MGGKGKKRREKNYIKAHGGQVRRLPPPPVPSSIDALPSKLRQIMSFTRSSQQSGSAEVSVNSSKKTTGDSGSNNDGIGKKNHLEDKEDLNNYGVKRKDNDESDNDGTHEKKKKKRKRKAVDDLRFEAGELTGMGSKRKERKKMRLEAMKKKHKKVEAEENLDFPGREEIKFGEVVQAPPKLVTIPKGKKSTLDASKERLRLEAVDAYRNRKGWTSRPGVHLPLPDVTSQSL